MIKQTFEFNDVRSRLAIVFEPDKAIPMEVNKIEVPLASFQLNETVCETFRSEDEHQLLELELRYQFLILDGVQAEKACRQEIEFILSHT